MLGCFLVFNFSFLQSTKYEVGMSWSDDMANEFQNLVNSVKGDLRTHESYVKADQFLSTIPWGLPESKINGEVSPTIQPQSQLKRVEDIPIYAESGSTSSQWHYGDLLQFVSLHPYVLEGVSSPQFTFDAQCSLDSALYWMEEDDTSALVSVSRAYFNFHQMSEAEVLCCLERFCDEYPEVLKSNSYTEGMSWSGKTQRKLQSLVYNVQDDELQKRETWVKAQKFVNTVPWDLPLT